MAKRKSSARRIPPQSAALRGAYPSDRRAAPARELKRIQAWIEEGDHERALAELEKLEKRYPYDHDVLNWQMLVLQETKQYPGLLRVALRAVELAPNDPIYQYNLVLAYAFNSFIALAWRQAERFLQRWPDNFMTEKVKGLVEPLETSVKEEMAKLGVAGEEGRRLLEQHEQIQVALQRQELAHAQELVQKIQERMPHFVAPLNNLALLQLIHGHVDEAITLEERVLEQDPDNINALSNLIHALVLSGRQEETAPLVQRLRGLPASGDYLVKKLEGLAWARDDQAIVDAFSEAEAAGALEGRPSEGIACHHAAVAAARLGDKKQARQLWRRALELSPGPSIARENLADLKNPPGQRQGAWPFSAAEWLPRPWVEQLSSRLPKKKGMSDQQIQRELTRYLEEYPQIVTMVPILLERGDWQARELVSFLTMASDHPALQAALRDFALGPWGTDEQRMKAAQYCTEHGILRRGQMVRMWHSGEQRELILMG